MTKIIKYSNLYYIQPVVFFIYSIFFWCLIISRIQKHGLELPDVIVLLFGLYLFILGIIHLCRRLKNSFFIKLDEMTIEAKYSNQYCIRQEWQNLVSAVLKKEKKVKSITLTSKDGTQLSFTEDIGGYKQLLSIINEHIKISNYNEKEK